MPLLSSLSPIGIDRSLWKLVIRDGFILVENGFSLGRDVSETLIVP
ncbi:hypothetical protein H6S82_03680 [Planktothrix sp. FACHB-1355]|uniref:Uncharacterized protein n=1 Tax=Aerosakkonema funiforme FACHB-1375 TaxID=2949571 RepID=A0A926VBR4_9CYAN|nr:MULTISPECIES: hypothetical protein [Oscillatoriales]MBD2179654.1 hypothetical protein [Aerosakkonema funiforme FACHB-1375]MBD3557957.1 hypothetical protein [Planktothrix sp. FACHB-1355]